MRQEVIDAWGLSQVSAIEGGLINETYSATLAGEPVILQRLHPLFSPHIHENIDAVTKHVHARGVTTPLLLPTKTGALWTESEQRIWRVQTAIPGTTIHSQVSAETAHSAASLVGHWHTALRDFSHTYKGMREHVHDTRYFLARLRENKTQETSNPWHKQAAELASDILAFADNLPDLDSLPQRHCHGDLKISNIRFAADKQTAVALLDLDTLGRLSLFYEIGDALRSWANTAGEDSPPTLSMEVAAATIDGFVSTVRDWVPQDELATIADGFWVIAMELAARFSNDVWDDQLFGWDAAQFSCRAEHNLLRARGQLQLARLARAQRDDLLVLLRG